MTDEGSSKATRTAAAVLFAASVAVAFAMVWRAQGLLARQLIDSYYYFEAANNFLRDGAPSIDWPQGPENKFFPGYPALLALWSLLCRSSPEACWGGLNLLLLPLAAAGSAALLRRMNQPLEFALIGGAFVAANPTFQRWCALPYSEPAALALLLAQALVLSRATLPAGGVAAFALLGGLACACRVEALVLQPVLLLWDRAAHRHLWGRWPRLAVGAALGAAPLAIWVGWLMARGKWLHYAGEGAQYFEAAAWFLSVIHSMSTAAVIAEVGDHPATSYFLTKVLEYGFAFGLLLAPAGVLGREARAAWGILLGYWALHGFWYYATERYNMVVLPLIALLLVRAFAWYAGQLAPARPVLRSRVFWALAAVPVAFSCAGFYLLRNNAARVNENIGEDEYRAAALMMESDEHAILSDMSADFAYFQQKTAWSLEDTKGFFAGVGRDADAVARFAAANDVGWVVLRKPAAEVPSVAGLRFDPRHDTQGRLFIYRLAPPASPAP